MPSSGDGTGWDETLPTNSEYVKDGPLEIRDLRKGTRIRLAKEHVLPASSSAGGEHKAGSAVAYYQSSAPTQRPDASTSLSAADNGRLFVDSDDKKLYVYVHGTGFVQIVGDLATGQVTEAKIATGAVTEAKLGTSAVTTNKIDAGAVTNAKLSTNSIGTSNIVALAVTEAKLAAAVTAQLLKATNFAIVADQKTSGTDGQTVTSGDWRKLDLNTEVTDTGNLVSLSSNVMTLEIGGYVILALCPVRGSSGQVAQTRLYNNTTAAVAITGQSVSTPASANSTGMSVLVGYVWCPSAYAFELQMQSSANVNTGGAGSYGTEVYTQVFIIKVS
jgi:hypothetical protein